MGARRGPHVVDLQNQPPLLGRAPPPSHRLHHHNSLPPPRIDALEDRLAAIDREIQALLLDNQRLAAVHVALRQELLKSQQDLHISMASASRAREAKESELREVVERSLHAEAAARRVEVMRAEIARVREDVRRMTAMRDEMVQRLVGMKGELGRVRAENSRIDMVAKEVEAMQHELQKGRAAIEFEKKAHAENQEQSKHMENSMVSMAHEIEKLRAELANAEKRAQAAAAANPVYTGAYVNPPEAGAYGSYADPYKQTQVQRTTDSTAPYIPGTGTQPSPAYNTQQPPG